MKNQIEGIVADWIIHHYCNTGGTKNNYNKIASAITDLFKEKMLEYVGEGINDKCDYTNGYNKAKAEIRERINLQRGLMR